ncbi:YndJ family protein [Aneurinibacillus tyrosinisolvens]|uniref:YndJ family protein n=1 Tax=Aneurinibacillus tyrosinisolvens TaxID=1443435 RepID=UPI0009E3B4A5|nr:YndJ family protein [Aneurinibacillus tyrosinisolvens]
MYVQTLAGLFLWLLSVWLLPAGYIERLLLFAFFVTVPLFLFVAEDPNQNGTPSRLYQTIQYLQLPMGALGALSFLLPAGGVAGALSLGWVLVTCLIGLYGLLRFLKRGFYFLEEFCIDAGFIYMPLGGFWFAAHRFSFDIMHFGSVIILLTAIHFHFSSLAAPIFTGLAGRMREKTRIYRWVAAGNVISPMLIAVGITYSRMFEWIAVVLFAAGMLVYVYYTVRLVLTAIKNRNARIFLTVSSLALLVTMGFAVCYGIGRGFGVQIVSIGDMVLVHGTGNAFGFVLLGLLAWGIIRPEPRANMLDFPHSRMRGQWRISRDFLERNRWVDTSRLPVKGLVDDFSIYKSETFDPMRIHPEIRAFYEQTTEYSLFAQTRWLRGFVFLSRVYKRISEKVEQLNLPLNNEKEQQNMEGAIIPIHSERDGRRNVRAWVRWDKESGKTIFVAVYSHHGGERRTYMNIALPLPSGNMTGVLRVEHDEADGLILTSLPDPLGKGDEGIYYFFRYLRLRLPLNETFHITINERRGLRAKHRMWMFGIPFLAIDYVIKLGPKNRAE